MITEDASEVESLKNKCEATKKKSEETLEKYLSKIDRLNGILDEMHGMLFKWLVSEVILFVLAFNLAKDCHSKSQLEIP